MVRKIHINFTNKWFYTFVLIIGIFALGVGVWATSHPSPGHTAAEIGEGTIANTLTISGGKVSIGTSSPQWGRLMIEDSAVPLSLRETDIAVDNGGLWRMTLDGGKLRFDVNTGSSGSEFGSNYLPQLVITKDGVVGADAFVGDGSGLTNIVARITGVGTCDSENDGLLRYRSSFCSADDVRSSSFDVCMRQTSSSYSWYSVQAYTWSDLSCDIDGCIPGEDYYECTEFVEQPGCYDSEPIGCYCTGAQEDCEE